MYAIRRWSVRHARGLNAFYKRFEAAVCWLHPLWKRIGYERLETPVAAVERTVKGLLFDCKMCGQCVLSSTGMSCPMNCPKNLRNGPCGGVRLNGHCEVKPEMECVWVAGIRRSKKTPYEHEIYRLNPPVDIRLKGQASWVTYSLGADKIPTGTDVEVRYADEALKKGQELKKAAAANKVTPATKEASAPKEAA